MDLEHVEGYQNSCFTCYSPSNVISIAEVHSISDYLRNEGSAMQTTSIKCSSIALDFYLICLPFLNKISHYKKVQLSHPRYS